VQFTYLSVYCNLYCAARTYTASGELLTS